MKTLSRVSLVIMLAFGVAEAKSFNDVINSILDLLFSEYMLGLVTASLFVAGLTLKFGLVEKFKNLMYGVIIGTAIIYSVAGIASLIVS